MEPWTRRRGSHAGAKNRWIGEALTEDNGSTLPLSVTLTEPSAPRAASAELDDWLA